MLRQVLSKIWNIDNVLSALLVVSVALNLFFSYGPPALARSSAEQQRLWAVGTPAPPLVVWDGVAEKVIHWKKDTRPTFIYVFRKDCGWCAKNIPALTDVVRLASPTFNIVLLTIDERSKPVPREYASLGVPVYWISGSTAAQGYRLTATPQTIVIGPRGEVAHFWRGAYRDRTGRDLRALLGGPIREAM